MLEYLSQLVSSWDFAWLIIIQGFFGSHFNNKSLPLILGDPVNQFWSLWVFLKICHLFGSVGETAVHYLQRQHFYFIFLQLNVEKTQDQYRLGWKITCYFFYGIAMKGPKKSKILIRIIKLVSTQSIMIVWLCLKYLQITLFTTIIKDCYRKLKKFLKLKISERSVLRIHVGKSWPLECTW